ncbi:glycosyltransferase [Nocardioides sp. SYSU DS0651]|uniref:glycosyltransferase n=1 Tax=Nocardioides sp. SYSU DS0651 TaxID=3415955 RepID=UPI003F4B4CD5
MRISLVSEHANPLAALGGEDAGGQNVHVAQLAAGLAARGHEVVVHTRRDRADGPDRVRAPGGYVVDHVAAGPAVPIPKDEIAHHLDELAAGLADRWTARPPDVVHAHFWMSGVASVEAAGSVARSLGRPVPVLQTFHALGVVKRRHQGAADTSPPCRIEMERRLLHDTQHVIATCSDEVRELRELGLPAGRASVIPCGVDTRRFLPASGSGSRRRGRRPRLVAVGRLVPRKGFATVIEALAGVPDAELLVVGGPPAELLDTDPEVRRLAEVAASCGVTDRVRFVGALPPEDMPRVLASSDVAVTGAWYEPFGIVPVEAMACGLPVVATDVGGHRDTVVPGTTGELVPPKDPAAMAAALRGLLADDRERKEYGAAGRRRAEELYDWRTVVERTEVVYRAAHGAPRPAATMAVREQRGVRR